MEQTRRVLEYVTLGNAFGLLLSLAWLHTRFVNPKGQGSTVSCLPAALERAGVDPAQLHVLQIHVRMPPDDRGGDESGGRGSRGQERIKLLSSSDDAGQTCDFDDVERWSDSSMQTDIRLHGSSPNDEKGGGEKGRGSTMTTNGGSRNDDGEGSGAVPADDEREGLTKTGTTNVGGGASSLPSESLPPEVFYSMKLVTGKDAVGTLSGPGTLGIERRGEIGVDTSSSSGGSSGGSVGSMGGTTSCGAHGDVSRGGVGEDQRSTVQTLVDALTWGKGDSSSKGETARREAGTVPQRGQMTSEVQQQQQQQQQQKWRRWRQQEGEGDTAGDGDGEEGMQDEVYLYSLEKGFLMLRPDLRRKHGIITANVTVSVHDPCLGGTVIQALVKDFVGYDTVVMNWLISLYGGRGFLYGVHSNELFNLNYATEFVDSTEDVGKFVVFKVGVMFTTLFLFFTTTTLVSFTLRETQERMLKFTFLLQHHVRHRLPYAPLIFTHVVESLVFVPIMVGILFFLFEFFSDQLLAFMVLSVVWLCEVYSVVSVRTSMSIRFFPQVFFLYFTLFHVYFFSFPFGFSYLALVTTVLFLQHSMLFFWNRYEVPALRAGVVSSLRPRQGGMVIGVVPRYDPHGMGLPIPRFAGEPALRQRAATLSLDSQREPRSAAQGWRQTIARSNSSPAPDSPAPGHARRASAPAIGQAASPSAVAARAAASTLRGSGASPTSVSAHPGRLALEWSMMRGWTRDEGLAQSRDGASGGTGGDDGNNNAGGDRGVRSGQTGTDGADGFGDTPANASAPLLGSFPFSLWNFLQITPSTQTSSAVPGAVDTTCGDGGRSSEASAAAVDGGGSGGLAATDRFLTRFGPGVRIGENFLPTLRADDGSAIRPVAPAAPPSATTASHTRGGGSSSDTDKRTLHRLSDPLPAEITRKSSDTLGARAAGRDTEMDEGKGPGPSVDENSAGLTVAPSQLSPGFAYGAGHHSLGVDRGSEQQQQQQQQQQRQESFREGGSVPRYQRFGLGGTQLYEDEDGDSTGRFSPRRPSEKR